MNGFLKLKQKWEKASPTVAIQSNLCGLMIISFNFTCRDFNAKFKLYAVI